MLALEKDQIWDSPFPKCIWACLRGFRFTCQLLHIPFISPYGFAYLEILQVRHFRARHGPIHCYLVYAHFGNCPHILEWYKPPNIFVRKFSTKCKNIYYHKIINIKAKHLKFFVTVDHSSMKCHNGLFKCLFFMLGTSRSEFQLLYIGGLCCTFISPVIS